MRSVNVAARSRSKVFASLLFACLILPVRASATDQVPVTADRDAVYVGESITFNVNLPAGASFRRGEVVVPTGDNRNPYRSIAGFGPVGSSQGSAITLAWDQVSSGIIDSSGFARSGPTQFIIQLFDARGMAYEATITVEVRNELPPVAEPESPQLDIDYEYTSDPTLLTLRYSITGSYQGRAPRSFEIELGNGERASGTTDPITHSYRVAGEYTVVVVADFDTDDGDTISDRAEIRVRAGGGLTPTLTFTFDSTPASDTVNFTVDGAVDAAATRIRYIWDFGDATPQSVTKANRADYVFVQHRTYPVRVEVHYEYSGRDAATVSLETAVTTPAPLVPQLRVLSLTATAAGSTDLGNTIPAGVPVNLSAADSTSPFGVVVSYEFDLDGDGMFELNAEQAPNAAHNFTSLGPIRVGLRIADDRGNRAARTFDFTVR